MPYIEEQERYWLSDFATRVQWELKGRGPGAVVYFLFVLLRRLYHLDGGGKFADHNEVYGILECTKMELYRRFTSKYEDSKIESNGDVT